MICIKAEIPQEICDIDDEFKENTFSIIHALRLSFKKGQQLHKKCEYHF